MTDTISISSIAKSKVAANKALKSLTIEQAERAIANLTAATETAKERHAAHEKAIAVKEIKTLMSQRGVSAADIAGSDSTPAASTRKARKKPGKVPAKYSITVADKLIAGRDVAAHRWFLKIMSSKAVV